MLLRLVSHIPPRRLKLAQLFVFYCLDEGESELRENEWIHARLHVQQYATMLTTDCMTSRLMRGDTAVSGQIHHRCDCTCGPRKLTNQPQHNGNLYP